MLATTHYCTTNADGTITTRSVSFGATAKTSVSTSTHSPNNHSVIVGVSRVTDYAIITVILDNILLV